MARMAITATMVDAIKILFVNIGFLLLLAENCCHQSDLGMGTVLRDTMRGFALVRRENQHGQVNPLESVAPYCYARVRQTTLRGKISQKLDAMNHRLSKTRQTSL